MSDAAKITQGYLATDPHVVRVRAVSNRGGFLTIKSTTNGITRSEWEYPIPLGDAKEMLKLCPRKVEKTRYTSMYGPHTWEVDVFQGDNAGLIIAEVELSHPDESFLLPPWVGEDVSLDPRYLNSNLLTFPFQKWKDTIPSGNWTVEP